jgi:RNase P subunit RPR2
VTIRLDSTQHSVVVLCTDCSWWRAFAFTKPEGWAAGARHESVSHPGQRQAQAALYATTREK